MLLAANGLAMPFGKPFRIVPRAGSDLSGDWVSNFNWVLSSSPLWKPLAPVIDDSILGWEAASVMPEFVIDGVREEDSHNVQAGVFYGWLNSNRAYLAELGRPRPYVCDHLPLRKLRSGSIRHHAIESNAQHSGIKTVD